jgi:hypothetical protein
MHIGKLASLNRPQQSKEVTSSKSEDLPKVKAKLTPFALTDLAKWAVAMDAGVGLSTRGHWDGPCI